MIELFNLMVHGQLLLGLMSGQTRVRAGGGLLRGDDMINRFPTFLPLPRSLGFPLPFTLLRFKRASSSCLAYELERIYQRSHFRDLTGRDEVRFAT